MRKKKLKNGECPACDGYGMVVIPQGQGYTLLQCPECEMRKKGEA